MTIWTSMSPSTLFPEGGVEIGLFFVADRKVRGSYPSFPAKRTIHCEDYTRNAYSDAREPEESDYYYCGACHEMHLRECFDGSPVIIGTEQWRRCEVELAPRLGYERIPVETPKDVSKNVVTYQEIEFKNRRHLTWISDGWFIAYQGHVVGLELFSMGRIRLTRDATLRLTPRVTI